MMACCAVTGSKAADLLKWDVTGSTGTTGSGVAAAPAAGVSGGAMTATTGTGTGNSTSPANTWNRTITTIAADSASAMTAGNYFQFTTTAATGYTVNISGMSGIQMSRTSTGPTSAGLFVSTDGGTVFTQTGTDFTVGTTLATAAAEFGATMGVTPIVMTAGSTLHWRVVVWGGSGGRVGIGKAATDDFILTGTSVPDVAARNLLWTGAGGSDWNTDPGNLNWADTGAGNAPTAFVTSDNATIDTAAAITVDGAGVTAGTIAVTNAGGTVSITGGAVNALSLAKSGAGTLSVSGTNALSGGTTLTGGTLAMESNGALGGIAVTVNGAVLKTAASVDTVANPLTIGSAGSTIETDGDVTFSGNVTGSSPGYAFTKTGPGQLTLSAGLGAQITAPVDFDITAGSAVFSGTGTTRQKNLIGTTTLNGNLTLAGSILMLHGSTIGGTGSILVTNATSSVTSRLNAGQVDVNVPLTLSTNVNVESPNGGNDLYLNGSISGGFGVVKKGNGEVYLVAENSHTTTAVEAGTLYIETGGTLGSGDVSVTAGATLRFNQSDAITVSNTITGEGTVRMSGAGTVTLSGTNTYVGVTNASDGTIVAPALTNGGVAGSIGQAPGTAPFLVFNGGTLSHTGPATSCDRAFTIGILGGTLAADGSGPLTMGATGPVAVTEPVPAAVGGLTIGTNYKIVDSGTTDFTLIGAADSNPGTVFTATGPGSGTGTVVFANNRIFRLSGTASGTSVLAADLINADNAPTNLTKNGVNTWSVTGTNTYTGVTRINAGVLRVDGDNTAATGGIHLYGGGLLGGNGSSGGAVTVMQAGGGLALRISDWTGAAGTGFDDLAVAAFDGASLPMTVTVDTGGLTNFSEGDKSFTVLTTTGAITNFNPFNVTVTAPGFTGTGYWSLEQSGNSLVLEYSLTPPDPYLAWIGPFGVADPAKGADPDFDGIENLLEFVLDGNPATSDPGILPQLAVDATHLVFTFTRREDSKSVDQKVGYGSDLVEWTDIVIPDAAGSHTVGVATVVVDDGTPASGPDTITVSIPRTSAVNGRMFARLSVGP